MLTRTIGAALAVSCTVLSMQPASKRVVTAGPTPVGPYSPAIDAGGLVYLSGTMPQDDTGAVVGHGDVGAQTRRVLERMRDLLAAAGTSLDQVVSVTVYLTSASDFQAMNDVYKTFWQKDPPTRTTIVTGLVLPDALVEMSMIAAPKGADRIVVHPDDWQRSPNPYSYAIRTGDTLFMSGLVSRNGRDNTAVAGDVKAQTRVVMDNAAQLLKAAGLSFANVVSARIFLPDASTFPAMNEVWREYFAGAAPPARATVKADLAGSQYHVEITLVASSSPREVIAGAGPANPNLSAAIKAGRRVYVSGMLGTSDATKGNAAAQTTETLARMDKALRSAGCSKADIVDGLVYITDLSAYRPMNDAYRAFFGAGFPARATVLSGLFDPDGLVEIMATAVCP